MVGATIWAASNIDEIVNLERREMLAAVPALEGSGGRLKLTKGEAGKSDLTGSDRAVVL